MKHLEHAYALTAHGMQGATVEHAVVLASVSDLSANWSYTALSRARSATRLLVHERPVMEGRGEYSPADRTTPPDRRELLARLGRRMLERDDEELALERLGQHEMGERRREAWSRSLRSVELEHR